MQSPDRGIVELEGGRLILVDKPAGMTSHDVVDRIRRLTGEKRVGHAGTLDPMATGLLVVAVGRGATRTLAGGLEGGKRYLATVQLGMASDTLDREGKHEIVAVPRLPRERIEQCLERIKGLGVQVPPMVSALKRSGIALYKLARRGWWIEREARPVEITECLLKTYEGDSLTLEIAGGGGLYVRSLVRDLGIMLGLPAALSELRRTSVGPWCVEDAVTLEELGTMSLEKQA